MKKLLSLLLLALLLTGCAQPAPEQPAPPVTSVPESDVPAVPSLPEDQSPEPEEYVSAADPEAPEVSVPAEEPDEPAVSVPAEEPDEPEVSVPTEEPDEPEVSVPAEEPDEPERPADPDAKPMSYFWECNFDVGKSFAYQTELEDPDDKDAVMDAFSANSTHNQFNYKVPMTLLANAEEWNAYFADKPLPKQWETPSFESYHVLALHFFTPSNGDRHRISFVTFREGVLTLTIHQTEVGREEAEGNYTAVVLLPKTKEVSEVKGQALVLAPSLRGDLGELLRITPAITAPSCKLDEPGYERDGNELEALFAKASNANRLESGEDEVPAFFLETAEAFEGFCSEVGARRINGKPEDLQAFFEEYSLCALYIPVIHHHIYVLKSMESKGGALRFLVEKSYNTLQDVEVGQVFFVVLPKDAAKIYDRFEASWAS